MITLTGRRRTSRTGVFGRGARSKDLGSPARSNGGGTGVVQLGASLRIATYENGVCAKIGHAGCTAWLNKPVLQELCIVRVGD